MAQIFRQSRRRTECNERSSRPESEQVQLQAERSRFPGGEGFHGAVSGLGPVPCPHQRVY